MSIFNLLNKVISTISGNDSNSLSEQFIVDLENYLADNELLSFNIPVYSSDYRAIKWSDKNMFYNCQFLLTNNRIIISRNSKYLKIFREIPLSSINKYDFQLNQKDNHLLTIQTDKAEDIITFHNKYAQEFNSLKENFSKFWSNNNINESVNTNYQICEQCKAKIIPGSKFCSNCGKRVKI